MSLLIQFRRLPIIGGARQLRFLSTDAAEAEDVETPEEVVEVPTANEDGSFRVLEIPGAKKREFVRAVHSNAQADGMRKRLFPTQPPRFKKMQPEDTKWSAVWPTAQTFKWSAVPLPIRQGYVKKGQAVVPGKYANAELMKVPNFFHLTPEHVRKHCSAIKRESFNIVYFCNPLYPLFICA